MNTYSRIRLPNRYDRQDWRLVTGVMVGVPFFVAFVFSYTLPASTLMVPWQFYSIAGIFAITALVLAILAFDKELY